MEVNVGAGYEDDVDDIDFKNYHGIYFGDENKKYEDPETGAHFEFSNICKRLCKIKEERERELCKEGEKMRMWGSNEDKLREGREWRERERVGERECNIENRSKRVVIESRNTDVIDRCQSQGVRNIVPDAIERTNRGDIDVLGCKGNTNTRTNNRTNNPTYNTNIWGKKNGKRTAPRVGNNRNIQNKPPIQGKPEMRAHNQRNSGGLLGPRVTQQSGELKGEKENRESISDAHAHNLSQSTISRKLLNELKEGLKKFQLQRPGVNYDHQLPMAPGASLPSKKGERTFVDKVKEGDTQHPRPLLLHSNSNNYNSENANGLEYTLGRVPGNIVVANNVNNVNNGNRGNIKSFTYSRKASNCSEQSNKACKEKILDFQNIGYGNGYSKSTLANSKQQEGAVNKVPPKEYMNTKTTSTLTTSTTRTKARTRNTVLGSRTIDAVIVPGKNGIKYGNIENGIVEKEKGEESEIAGILHKSGCGLSGANCRQSQRSMGNSNSINSINIQTWNSSTNTRSTQHQNTHSGNMNAHISINDQEEENTTKYTKYNNYMENLCNGEKSKSSSQHQSKSTSQHQSKSSSQHQTADYGNHKIVTKNNQNRGDIYKLQIQKEILDNNFECLVSNNNSRNNQMGAIVGGSRIGGSMLLPHSHASLNYWKSNRYPGHPHPHPHCHPHPNNSNPPKYDFERHYQSYIRANNNTTSSTHKKY